MVISLKTRDLTSDTRTKDNHWILGYCIGFWLLRKKNKNKDVVHSDVTSITLSGRDVCITHDQRLISMSAHVFPLIVYHTSRPVT